MIVSEEKQLFLDMAFSQRRIRMDNNKGMMKVVDELFEFINYFSYNISYRQSSIDGVLLKDIPVIKEIAPYIYPTEIRWDASDDRCVNLIDSSTRTISVLPDTINHFIQLEAEFRGFFKLSMNENTVSLDSIKQVVSIKDVEDRLAVKIDSEWKMVSTDNPLIPYPVKHYSAMFEKSHFNDSVKSVVKDYSLNLRFSQKEVNTNESHQWQ